MYVKGKMFAFTLFCVLHLTAVWAIRLHPNSESVVPNPSCPPQYELLVVKYSLEFPSSACPPANGTSPPDYVANVAVPAGSTALDVMETAVGIDRGFQFSATNYGPALGFSIDQISGTASRGPCFWFFFVKTCAGSDAQSAPVGVSSFSICSELEIIWRFDKFSG